MIKLYLVQREQTFINAVWLSGMCCNLAELAFVTMPSDFGWCSQYRAGNKVTCTPDWLKSTFAYRVLIKYATARFKSFFHVPKIYLQNS